MLYNSVNKKFVFVFSLLNVKAHKLVFLDCVTPGANTTGFY